LAWAFLAGLLGLSGTSCAKKSEERQAVYPVRGRVLFPGRAVAGAVIVFHPRDNSGPATPNPSGQVEADGAFSLGTYEAGDGDPAGRYTITISLRQSADGLDDGPNLLPIRYGRVTTSGLHAVVKDRVNDLPPIRLKN
jgi:hypothetical protein